MDWAAFEESRLAPYAMRSRDSRGRRYPEPPHPFRGPYQRDRERIVHCSAFRRLMGKTQVLVGRINDHHRTRLTHTLEVAQISRTIARRLLFNEDLTEAIALSHDLGHPPFGHAGERALQECMKDHGGFEHNLYGLRRVEVLETPYPAFPGLNLSWEVREAFVQHGSPGRPIPSELKGYLEVGGPLLEAQLVDAADSLAYATHDTDDALGTNLISLHDLEEVPLWRHTAASVRGEFANLSAEAFRTVVIRALIVLQVDDLIAETEQRLKAFGIDSLAKVRSALSPLVGFSADLQSQKKEMERFLFQRVYRHHAIMGMANKGQRFVREMFNAFVRSPELLPERHRRRREAPDGTPLERVVADYLAGMTDRFARHEYLRLFHPDTDC